MIVQTLFVVTGWKDYGLNGFIKNDYTKYKGGKKGIFFHLIGKSGNNKS